MNRAIISLLSTFAAATSLAGAPTAEEVSRIDSLFDHALALQPTWELSPGYFVKAPALVRYDRAGRAWIPQEALRDRATARKQVRLFTAACGDTFVGAELTVHHRPELLGIKEGFAWPEEKGFGPYQHWYRFAADFENNRLVRVMRVNPAEFTMPVPLFKDLGTSGCRVVHQEGSPDFLEVVSQVPLTPVLRAELLNWHGAAGAVLREGSGEELRCIPLPPLPPGEKRDTSWAYRVIEHGVSSDVPMPSCFISPQRLLRYEFEPRLKDCDDAARRDPPIIYD